MSLEMEMPLKHVSSGNSFVGLNVTIRIYSEQIFLEIWPTGILFAFRIPLVFSPDSILVLQMYLSKSPPILSTQEPVFVKLNKDLLNVSHDDHFQQCCTIYQ
jgi:hypothetical protein